MRENRHRSPSFVPKTIQSTVANALGALVSGVIHRTTADLGQSQELNEKEIPLQDVCRMQGSQAKRRLAEEVEDDEDSYIQRESETGDVYWIQSLSDPKRRRISLQQAEIAQGADCTPETCQVIDIGEERRSDIVDFERASQGGTCSDRWMTTTSFPLQRIPHQTSGSFRKFIQQSSGLLGSAPPPSNPLHHPSAEVKAGYGGPGIDQESTSLGLGRVTLGLATLLDVHPDNDGSGHAMDYETENPTFNVLIAENGVQDGRNNVMDKGDISPHIQSTPHNDHMIFQEMSSTPLLPTQPVSEEQIVNTDMIVSPCHPNTLLPVTQFSTRPASQPQVHHPPHAEFNETQDTVTCEERTGQLSTTQKSVNLEQGASSTYSRKARMERLKALEQRIAASEAKLARLIKNSKSDY